MPIIAEAPKRPITGFKSIDKRRTEAPKSSGQIPDVKDPTIPFTGIGSGARASMLATPNSSTFADIENGCNVDSYLHQGVAKYAEKIWKEGHAIYGENSKAVEYIKTRLDMMTASTGVYWEFALRYASRDYVKFGNGFLVKGRMSKTSGIFGQKKTGMRRTGARADSNKPPVGAYYAVSPLYMQADLDNDGKQKGWKQVIPGGGEALFDLDDVIHFAYNRPSGALFGISHLVPVLDDVRALRQMEEMIVHLVFKSLNPLIHHEVPDTTGTGLGDQNDVDRAAAQHNVMAVNGYLVTPPGHKITAIGMESKALRAEGYFKLLKERVYAGLGLSGLIMGEMATTSVGASEGFSSIMHDRVRFYQKEFAEYVTYSVVWELLLEGGFDPIFNEKDRVYWRFNEVDIDRRIREEAHTLLMYQGNAITEDEIRTTLHLPILADSDREKLYINTVQIPLALSRSQSEAVSGTGNSGNASESHAAQAEFFSGVRGRLGAYVATRVASREPLDLGEMLTIIDGVFTEAACDRMPSPAAVAAARESVARTLEVTGARPSSALSATSLLHGWLTSASVAT